MSLSGILRITACWRLPFPARPSRRKEAAAPAAVLNSGDTAWMLVSCALVLLMLPGLAMFYGGLTRTRNVLGTMMHSFAAMGIMGVQWVIFGFALAFRCKRDHTGCPRLEHRLFPAGRCRSRNHLGRDEHPYVPVRHVPGHVRHHHPRPDRRGPSPNA